MNLEREKRGSFHSMGVCGASLTEYVILLTSIAVLVVSVIWVCGDNIRGIFAAESNCLAGSEHCLPKTRTVALDGKIPAGTVEDVTDLFRLGSQPGNGSIASTRKALADQPAGSKLPAGLFGSPYLAPSSTVHPSSTEPLAVPEVEMVVLDPPGMVYLDGPSLDGMETKLGKRISYTQVDGDLFVQGPGDREPIDPNDVYQGFIPDCYLISALAGIADRNPEFIRQIVHEEDGFFRVKLYKHDENLELSPKIQLFRKVLAISEDDRLVFTREADSPLISETDNQEPTSNEYKVILPPGASRKYELWPHMIEAGFAGINDGWSKIKAAFAFTGLEALTGQKASVEYSLGFVNGGWMTEAERNEWSEHLILVMNKRDVKLHTDKLDIQSIADRLAAGEIVIAGTVPQESVERNHVSAILSDKLMSSHAYYVSRVLPEQGLVIVQNPHGWKPEGIVLSTAEFQEAYIAVAGVSPPKPSERRRLTAQRETQEDAWRNR